ncbi:hypothetical protein TIFTF001_003930 [Ficus carica]|uniref:Uncharacterized protein n=1 Tax=Ficus carica TaxID=3494 RepID=A0AA87Z9W4_FICCA|nr:hypothetical protein TIFTF001_003930 [Ficus carica]
MAAMNSSVLACNYAISGAGMSDLTSKVTSACPPPAVAVQKMPVIRAQQAAKVSDRKSEGRRAAMLYLAATLFTAAASSNSAANAGVIEEYLEKSKANKVHTLFCITSP